MKENGLSLWNLVGVIKNGRSLEEERPSTLKICFLINHVPPIDMIPWILNDFPRRVGCIYGHKMQTI